MCPVRNTTWYEATELWRRRWRREHFDASSVPPSPRRWVILWPGWKAASHTGQRWGPRGPVLSCWSYEQLCSVSWPPSLLWGWQLTQLTSTTSGEKLTAFTLFFWRVEISWRNKERDHEMRDRLSARLEPIMSQTHPPLINLIHLDRGFSLQPSWQETAGKHRSVSLTQDRALLHLKSRFPGFKFSLAKLWLEPVAD